MTAQEIANQIETILKKTLPQSAYIEVVCRKLMGSEYIKIMFASKDFLINNVEGQRPDVVSLALDVKTFLLEGQCYGCMGGLKIFLTPNKDDPREKYLAMVGTKVPFRKPKQTHDAVMAAIERFAKAWLETLKNNYDRLRHHDKIDYKEFLNL